ncbi:hypothetical protein [Methanospirillum hungatei]|uniref:hypothetical protein n=1 Tax=Methanospirillum hungatei TaxID=2203 RepID=UPI0026EE72FC|nr:hypothetical protein [Methanospirillum hungatei]MCA1917329.1 hypothetical protein [Methanospirillum hungatei]
MPSKKICWLGLLATLIELESDEVPKVYEDIIVRFGNINVPGEGYRNDNNAMVKNPDSRKRIFTTVAGYMDGYL